MMQEQIKREEAVEILKGLLLCVFLLPVGIIFLILGTLTGLAELLVKWLEND